MTMNYKKMKQRSVNHEQEIINRLDFIMNDYDELNFAVKSTSVVSSALIDVLIKKGIITKEELETESEKIFDDIINRNKENSKYGNLLNSDVYANC